MDSVAAMFDKGPYGYYAKGGTLKHHFGPETWGLFDKVGYVLQSVTHNVVRANNGKDGKPLWIQVGEDAFDISSKTPLAL